MARIRSIKPEKELPMEPVAIADYQQHPFDIEFRGFFFGEGHMDLIRQGSTTRAVAPRIRLALREDDKPVLEAIQARYGGNLSYRKNCRSWNWQLTGKHAVLNVLTILRGNRGPNKIN